MINNEGVWRYRLDQLFVYRSTHLLGIEFANRWITIIDGVITVNKNYAWDGCSPAWYLPFFGWVGSPDGKRNAEGIPLSYHATLVHDALCQFRTEVLISKAQTIAIFKEMLLKGGFPRWRATLYATMVDWFGPQNWLGSKLTITEIHP